MKINTAISISLLLIAFTTSYHFVYYIPSLQKSNQINLEKCINSVDQRFQDPNFIEAMKNNLKTNEEVNIILSVIQSQREECYKKYPVK